MTNVVQPTLAELQQKLFNTTDPMVNLRRRALALASGLPLIAQTLVEEGGRKIQLKPLHPSQGVGCTDGKTIYLMPMPVPSGEADFEKYLLGVALRLGLVHHEVGHVNETDFGLPRPVDDPVANNALGIIEDIRQEIAHIRKLPASRRYLDALGLASILIGLDGPLKDGAPPFAVFTAYLLYELRSTYRQEPHYAPLAAQAEKALEEAFTKGIVVRLQAILPKVLKLKTTADSFKLSKEIADFVRDELEMAKQQQQQQQQAGQGQSGQGQGQAQGNAGDDADGSNAGGNSASGDSGSGNGAGKNPGNQTQSQQDQPSAGASDGSDQDATDQLVQALQSLSNGDDADQGKGDLDEAIRGALQKLAEELSNNHVDSYDDGAADLASIEAADEGFAGELYTGATSDLTTALSVVSRLRAKLKNQLQALSLTRTSHGRRGRIDVRRVYRAALGDPKVFRAIDTGVTVDTSVFLLLDVSGSMSSGDRIDLANQAVFASACALQAMPGVEVAVGAFPYRQLVLPFGGRANREQGRFQLRPVGSTPMHEGITMAHRALGKRRNPRKLLIVMTDGEADCMATARAALDHAASAGIETFGVGIMTSYVEHLFPASTVVNDVNELPERMLTLLKTRLTSRRAVA